MTEYVTLGTAIDAAIEHGYKIKAHFPDGSKMIMEEDAGYLSLEIGEKVLSPLTWIEGTKFEIIKPKMRLMTIKEICEKFDEVSFSNGRLQINGKPRMCYEYLNQLGIDSSRVYSKDLYIEEV